MPEDRNRQRIGSLRGFLGSALSAVGAVMAGRSVVRMMASARSDAVRGFRTALLEMGVPKEIAEGLAQSYPKFDMPVVRKAGRHDTG